MNWIILWYIYSTTYSSTLHDLNRPKQPRHIVG